MLLVFVFPSVTDVMITRHRQNMYLPLYERRWRRAVVVAAAVGVEGGGGTASEKSLTSKISDACLALNANNQCKRVATTG